MDRNIKRGRDVSWHVIIYPATDFRLRSRITVPKPSRRKRDDWPIQDIINYQGSEKIYEYFYLRIGLCGASG